MEAFRIALEKQKRHSLTPTILIRSSLVKSLHSRSHSLCIIILVRKSLPNEQFRERGKLQLLTRIGERRARYGDHLASETKLKRVSIESWIATLLSHHVSNRRRLPQLGSTLHFTLCTVNFTQFSVALFYLNTIFNQYSSQGDVWKRPCTSAWWK